MNLSKRWMVFILFLLASIACDLVNNFTQVERNPATDFPTSVPTAEILFQDDFSNPSSGWSVYGDEVGSNSYVNGGFRIILNKANWYAWSNPGKYFKDAIIEADAMKVSGPDQNDYGILCRYKDENNYYRLVLSNDGYYGISKVMQGKEQLIGMDDLQRNTQVIHTGDGSYNHIRADCIGDQLILYANGTLLVEARDSNIGEGDVGLTVGSYDTQGVDILFDNFTVTRP